MVLIFLSHGFPTETATVILMINKNTKAMVHYPDCDTEFFDIVTGVLKEDILILFLF